MSRFRMPRWVGLAGLFALAAIECLMPTRSAEGQEVGVVFRDSDVCPAIVVVPAGSFMMGSPRPRRREIGTRGHSTGYASNMHSPSACTKSGSLNGMHVQGGGCRGYEPFGWHCRGRRPTPRT